MAGLIDVLSERGFRAVDSDLPGGWATDGSVTVNVQTEGVLHGTASHNHSHTVRVFDGPASLLSIGSEELARYRDSSAHFAVRHALDLADEAMEGAHA